MHGLGQVGGDARNDVAFEQVDERRPAAAAQDDRIHTEGRGDVDDGVGLVLISMALG